GREVLRREYQHGPTAKEVRLSRAVVTPDGSRLLVGAQSRIWELDPRTGDMQRFTPGFAYYQAALAVSPDSRRLTAANQRGTIQQFDLTTGRLCYAPRPHADAVPDLAYSPDGRTLAIPRGPVVTLELTEGRRAWAARS